YRIVGSLRFYDRKEIKDLLAYLRLLLVPDDDLAFARAVNTPARGIGKTTLDQIAGLAASRGLSLHRAARAGLEEGLFAARAATSLGGFLDLLDALRARAARTGGTGGAPALDSEGGGGDQDELHAANDRAPASSSS